MNSILTSVKKLLGIAEDYEAFDADILMHINAAFAQLNQIGIGPSAGFFIQDKTATWDTFLGNDPKLNLVKPYVYIFVRLLFDPPSTSYVVEALKQQLKELEWRLNVLREETAWIDPQPELCEDGMLDGGEVV